MSEGPVIVGRNLEKHYTVGGGFMREPQVVKALRGVSFSLSAGKTLAVVGESGCGKSTLARLITMIEEPTGGTIEIDGWNVTSTGEEGRKAFRTHVQIVFQDPYGSLNPRQKVGSMLEEPLLINTKDNAAERQDKAREMLRLVGLRPEHYDRYPHMFSGGQRQRIAIARALMLNPKILVLDEPVSALDVSIQAQILNLLAKLQEKLQLAYIFISHNLSVVRHVADDVLVMYLGRTVEAASRDELFEYPRHPYTRALLSATPVADPARVKQRIRLEGELPSPINPPSGCAFNPRCPLVIEKCTRDMPELESHGEAQVACYRAGEKISGSSGR
ncbi:MAG: dipeptide ABC transporter ATP-binding protein [Tepidamorphaceae bacterium]